MDMKKLNVRYKKLKKLLENEFNYSSINYNDVEYDSSENEYCGLIGISGICAIYVNLDNKRCRLTFNDISFDVYYKTDNIRELCEKLDKISDKINY